MAQPGFIDDERAFQMGKLGCEKPGMSDSDRERCYRDGFRRVSPALKPFQCDKKSSRAERDRCYEEAEKKIIQEREDKLKALSIVGLAVGIPLVIAIVVLVIVIVVRRKK